MKTKNETIELDHYLKLFVKSSLFILVATILSKLFSYGYKIVIARNFGAEIYGLFSLALIVIGIFSSLATMGLSEGLVRYISFYRGRRLYRHIMRLIKSLQTLFLFTGVICTIILVLISPILSEHIFHSDKFTPLLIGMAFALPFMILANLSLGILRGFERVNTYTMLINIYQNTSRLILLLILVLSGIGVISIPISFVLTFVGLWLLSYCYAKKNIVNLPRTNLPSWKKIMPSIFSYAWPLLFTGILYSIFYWTDSLVLGYFNNATEVGQYNAAITIVSLFGIVPDLFMQLFFPIISFKLSEGKKELIQALTQQIVKWIYFLSVPIFIVLFLFSKQWLTLLFSSDFVSAEKSLQILVIGALCASITGLSTSLISIKGRTRLVLTDFLIFTTINLILDISLVPKIGMLGAAIATFVTQILFLITVIRQIKTIYGFNPIKNYIQKLIAITAGLLLIGGYFKQISDVNLWTAIIFSILLIIIYVIAIFILRIFDSEDKMIIKSILKKIGLHKS